MIGALRRAYDGFRGFGDYAFSIPPLDEAFLPNSALDGAPVVLASPAADNLCTSGGRVYFSDGPCLATLSGETVGLYDTAITALAGDSAGALAVGLGDAILRLAPDGAKQMIVPPCPGGDITALAILSDGSLAVAIGSEVHRRADWQNDLMLRGKTGSVWRIAPDGTARALARGLAYPLGIAEAPDGSLIVSLAWDHALLRVTREGGTETVLDNLPAYPGRLIRTEGGYWLSCLSIRNQLVEFTLRETAYVRRMMAEVRREFWVCPQLQPPQSPMSVMQAGAGRHHGEIKPWAPSLSYGLIVRLDAGLSPVFTLHSRADGDRHGLTSLALSEGRLLATSVAARGIVELPMTGGPQ